MITKDYGLGLRKQAAALRAQADLLEKQAAAGAVAKSVLDIAGRVAAKLGAPTSKLAGKALLRRAMGAANSGVYKPTTNLDLSINRALTAIRNNSKAVGAAEAVVGALGAGAGGAALKKGINNVKQAEATAGARDAEVKKAEEALAQKQLEAESLPQDTGGNDDTDYNIPPKSGISPNLITGGATAAGGIVGGILGNTLAPEKYKKLMTAIGALTGAAVSGAGAHYGQKYYNA